MARDLNTKPTPSDVDAFPGSLAEREARAYRPDPAVHRGTKLAVGAGDGTDVGAGMEELMEDLLWEIRQLRLGMILAGTCTDTADYN